ncbi:MAG TPA: CAP domain-containing protein [Actinomycetes bacterium]|nr:CAP domain-containing protein [Actinomycetes bacterium]
MRHARTTASGSGDSWDLPLAQTPPGRAVGDHGPSVRTALLTPVRSRAVSNRPAWVRSSAMTAAIVVPVVISLVLLATAGPGRIFPRPTAESRLVATPARSGDPTRLVTLINQERVRHGLAPLMVSRRLNAMAAAHSADMAGQKRLWADPNPGAGILNDISISEHVDCAASADQAFARLMSSPEKRAKVLQPNLNTVGLGAASGSCLWITAMFAKIPVKQQTGSVKRKPIAPTTTVPAARSRSTPTTRPSPPSTAPAATAPIRSPSTADKIAKDLFARVNAERAARDLPALAWSTDLARLAANWSEHMASSGTFAHRDLGAARSQPGISRFSALGENIAWVEGYQNDAFQLHIGWMKSDGHRHNILQPGFDSIGIGVVCSGGKAWATQNFGRASSSTPSLSSTTPPQDPITAVKLDGLVC